MFILEKKETVGEKKETYFELDPLNLNGVI